MQQQEVLNVTPTSGRGIAASTPRLQPKMKSPTVHRLDFKAIKRAASFERVLAYYGIELGGGRGAQRKALCPFHRDTRPSLNVNIDMKVFNCFPCGDGGDIVKFVAKQEHPTDPEAHLIEAAKKLAEICGISIDDARRDALTKPAERATGEFKNGKMAVPNPPLSFQLKVDPTHPYLAERGLSPETVERFGLGYCVSETSIMRQRVVIPIHNERNELVAYAGRWPGDSGWSEGSAKYTLPPKFQKMRVLFNLNRVIEGMLEFQWPDHEQHVVVVEGFFGVFAIHPLAPCVGLMGSAVSKEHLELLARTKIRFVTLLLDGPGKAFTPEERRVWDDRIAATTHNLASYGFFVHAPELDLGEQPDTISRERLAGLVSI
jgi:DNA primase